VFAILHRLFLLGRGVAPEQLPDPRAGIDHVSGFQPAATRLIDGEVHEAKRSVGPVFSAMSRGGGDEAERTISI
jgi:hypothetical protein